MRPGISQISRYSNASWARQPSNKIQADLNKLFLPWNRRHDVWIWITGIVFIGAILSLIFGLSMYRNWHPYYGFVNDINTFTNRSNIEGANGCNYTEPKDILDYNPYFAWIGYVLHQNCVWMLIFVAQTNQGLYPKTTGTRINWVAQSINCFFCFVHLANTHTTYQGICPTVGLASVVGALIMLSTLVALLQYVERGLIFGWPVITSASDLSQRLRLHNDPILFVRKYHGYAFAWASIYTFWYYPMTNTVGNILGISNAMIIMLQGSLMYTKFHQEYRWRLFIETFVIAHVGVVMSQITPFEGHRHTQWTSYVFGLLLIFALTQIFLLTLWERISPKLRLLPILILAAIVISMYIWVLEKRWSTVLEIFYIPLVYYGLVLICWVILYMSRICNCLGPSLQEKSRSHASFFMFLTFCIYGMLIGLAVFCQNKDRDIRMLHLVMFFLAVDTSVACIAMLFTAQAINQPLYT